MVETIENPFINSPGAGFSVGKMLIERNISFFIAGSVGPNLRRILEQNKIKVIEERNKTIIEIIDELNQNNY